MAGYSNGTNYMPGSKEFQTEEETQFESSDTL